MAKAPKSAPQSKTHNLVLVNHPGGQERRDFDEIAAKIARLAPQIETYIVPEDHDPTRLDDLPDIWSRPAFTVSFRRPSRFRPVRGIYYSGRQINKAEQARRYQSAGVSVPDTLVYEFGRALNPALWGPFVIMKTTRPELSSYGKNVFLLRTERAAVLASRIYPPDHIARASPVLIQRFIDTGEYSMSYRVLLLFGEPLYCMIFRQRQPRAPLTASDDELLASPIASNAREIYVHELVDDAEIMAFARRAAAAMPAIPLQGIDVVREVGTGKLYALENNAGGNTWHFSSKLSTKSRMIVSREERIAQFGAFDLAAATLARRTLTEAR